jgi:hypothetical protein
MSPWLVKATPVEVGQVLPAGINDNAIYFHEDYFFHPAVA